MENVYTPILRRIRDILSQNGYKIVKEDGVFYIMDGKPKISEIIVQVTDKDVLLGKTRFSYATLVNVDVFNVSWLNTHKKYEGQQLGTLLLIYAVCDLKMTHPNVNHVVLDDDTDKSRRMRNIYNKLGFSFRDFVCLGDKRGEVVMSGPEKQLELNDEFISVVKKKLNIGKSRRYKVLKWKI